MNNITKAILDYYDLKLNQRFKIDNSNYKGIYYFKEDGELVRETNNGFENVSREILGRLAYGTTIFKENRFDFPKKTVKDLKKYDDYYYIDDILEIENESWEDDSLDNKRLEVGNAFVSYKEAEFELERRKIEAQLLKYGSRKFDENDSNFVIHFNVRNKTLENSQVHYISNLNSIYFRNYQTIRKALEEIGEDKIKKYFFGVE